jgi:hypothetical protein
VRTFLYMPDEPAASSTRRSCAWPPTCTRTRARPRAPGLRHQALGARADEAIDIWCSPPQRSTSRAPRSERARGHAYWTYNSGRPTRPPLLIDAPATEARAMAWALFKHDVDVYFYWHGVHWLHNRQKQGERRQDVWTNPITFDNRGQPHKTDHGYLNGDGVLFYPGEEKVHPREDRGIAGPCPRCSSRTCAAGVQDHLYLTLAAQRGQGGRRRRRPAQRGARGCSRTRADRRLRARRATRSKPRGSGWPRPSCRGAGARAMRTCRGVAALAGALAPPPVPTRSCRPRLLVAERDAFSGIPALKARYATGARPSDDGPGWALSYLLTGDEAFARARSRRCREGSCQQASPPASTSTTCGGAGVRLALRLRLLRRRAQGPRGHGARGRRRAHARAAVPRRPAQASYHNHTARELRSPCSR